MKLVGLEISMNGTTKFIGKVNVCPPCGIKGLQGRVILYKEENFKDAVSWKLEAVGLDRYVWDYAVKEFKCEGVVIYCKDRRCTILLGKEKLNNTFILDMGEGSQIRVPIKECKIIENTQPIKMGYTTNLITVPIPAPEKEPEDKQAELF